jgi:hypothetical protein
MTQYTRNYITGKLITPDKSLTVIVIDSNGKQKTFLRFDTPNEIVKLGPVQEGDILALGWYWRNIFFSSLTVY